MKYLALLFVLLCAGCEGGDAPNAGVAAKAASNVKYSKDERTGLCFASVTSTSYYGYQVVSITNVPCKNVEKYLEQP